MLCVYKRVYDVKLQIRCSYPNMEPQTGWSGEEEEEKKD